MFPVIYCPKTNRSCRPENHIYVNEIQSDGNEIESDRNEIQSDGNENQSDGNEIESDGNEIQSDVNGIESDTDEITSDNDAISGDSQEIDFVSEEIHFDSKEIHFISAEINPKTCQNYSLNPFKTPNSQAPLFQITTSRRARERASGLQIPKNGIHLLKNSLNTKQNQRFSSSTPGKRNYRQGQFFTFVSVSAEKELWYG